LDLGANFCVLGAKVDNRDFIRTRHWF
jgi:hypothetical protein